MKIERLGEVHAITYACDISTGRGLCRMDQGSFYRHEWKVHRPQLIHAGEKYGIACRIHFLDGGVLDGGKSGIDDLPKDEKQSCALALTNPEPSKLDVIGTLLQIEIKGKDKVYKFDGAVLCVNKDGDRLYIMNRKDITAAAGVLENPEASLEAVARPTAAQEYGPRAWATLHNFAAMYDPQMKDTAAKLVDDVIGKFPCDDCRTHGLAYLQANPIDYASRETFARGVWSFHNDVNKRLGKPEYAWNPSLSPIQNVCVGCGKENKSAPLNILHAASDGLKMFAAHGCIHCESTLKAAKAAGVAVTPIYDHNRPATPVLELVRDGKIVKSHVGAMSSEELKRFVS